MLSQQNIGKQNVNYPSAKFSKRNLEKIQVPEIKDGILSSKLFPFRKYSKSYKMIMKSSFLFTTFLVLLSFSEVEYLDIVNLIEYFEILKGRKSWRYMKSLIRIYRHIKVL